MSDIDWTDVDVLATCHFPTHDGKKWEDVIEEDRNFVLWLVGGEGPDLNERLYDYLMDLLEG